MLRASECIVHSRTFEKIVSAKCEARSPRRPLPPVHTNTREAIRRVVAGIVRARIRG
jgi:hypothetical protein